MSKVDQAVKILVASSCSELEQAKLGVCPSNTPLSFEKGSACLWLVGSFWRKIGACRNLNLAGYLLQDWQYLSPLPLQVVL